MRTLIILLAVVAGILSWAIYVAANSPRRSRAEAALAEAEEARKEVAQQIETLEAENASLRKELKTAKANLAEKDKRLAPAEKEAVRLQGELDVALKQVAELNQKYSDAQVKKAEDAAAAARETEIKAGLDTEAVRKDAAVTALKPAAVEADVVHAGNKKHKNGKNNGVAGNARRGPVASLPRTTPSFSELDTDHDGRLTLKEYRVGYPDAVDVEQEFKSLDTNGDGTLSIDEYKAGHPDPPVVRTKRPKKN